MDALLRALGHEMRLRLVRELRRSPGPKHGDLLRSLGLAKSEAGTLTKHLASLEEAGVVRREGAQYYLSDADAAGAALVALADLHVSARRLLAERAQLEVPEAERLAEELRREVAEGPSSE
jgi:DNA-binding transcriptional ArsR family regulator